MPLAYEELVNFIAEGPSSQRVAEYEASETTKAYVADLIRREKTSSLSAEEKAELDHFLHLEHLMRLAKARAQMHLKQE
jgi:hypothetical protein